MHKEKDCTNITSVLSESRVFAPASEFSRSARVASLEDYRRLYRESIDAPEQFWDRAAREELVWSKPWHTVLQWQEPFAKWFVGGQLNASVNCLDRHLDGPTANQAALIWEGEPGDERVLTYRQLHREVCRFANVLKRQGLAQGDRVIIYLPLVPEDRKSTRLNSSHRT